MVAHPVSFQCLNNLGNLLLGPAFGQLRHLGGLRFSFPQRLQHQLPGHTKQIRQHIAQFHVGVFPHLLDAVLGVPQQRRQPPAILIVSFVAFAVLHFLRIGQPDFEAPLQYVVYRLPLGAQSIPSPRA